MTRGDTMSPAKAVRLTIVIVALFVLVVGCTTDTEPELPSSTDTVAIADRVTGPNGQEFLRDVTSTPWKDDGGRAAELFSWIPRDTTSTDDGKATRAGRTARAVASFLAEDRHEIGGAPANPLLWQAFAQTLIPFLGAMVGDARGTAGFEPLDGIGSDMGRTASLFAAMTKNADADRTLTQAASARAHAYEVAFAKAALADPLLADRDAARADFLRAARLRGIMAAASKLVDPQSERFTVGQAQTELAYQVVSLTAHPDDPHIDPQYFKNGRLLSPSEISEEDWSTYDSQLTVYLATSPRINDAIRQFGDAYDVIAAGR
jgi:hypothetical protein